MLSAGYTGISTTLTDVTAALSFAAGESGAPTGIDGGQRRQVLDQRVPAVQPVEPQRRVLAEVAAQSDDPEFEY